MAKSAASVAIKVANPNEVDLLLFLKESYAYWVAHEKPYPVNGGAVPDSPRAEIIQAMMLIERPLDAELLLMANDDRSDVAEIAMPLLLERLEKSNEFRTLMLAEVMHGSIKPSILLQAINKRIVFSNQQSKVICGMMQHDEPLIRYAATKILTTDYLSKEEIQYWIKVISTDSEPEIREVAGKLSLEKQ